MTQSSLIARGGEGKEPERIQRPLKVSVPHFDNTGLIKGYANTLIGRCFNPKEQDVKALVVMLPKIWKMEDRIVGADLGLGKFQLDFDDEEDIKEVMKMQPFHFDYWMISLVRWQPVRDRTYPSTITFWIRVLGIPIEFWAMPTFESIGAAVGHVEEIDIDYGRIKVTLDGFKPLVFEVAIDFKGGEYHGGEEALVTLKYEKLFGFCETCFSLCHETLVCPLSKDKEHRSTDKNTKEVSSRAGDRLASYKGVVIKGTEDRKEASRKGYSGKGKGKMFEEDETQWSKAVEKEYGDRHRSGGRTRGEGRDHYQKSPYKVESRRYEQGNRHRFSGARGRRRERSPRNYYQPQERSRVADSNIEKSGENPISQPELQSSSPPGLDVVAITQVTHWEKEVQEQGEIVDDGMELVNDFLQHADVLEENVEGKDNVVEKEDERKSAEEEEEFEDASDHDSMNNKAESMLVDGAPHQELTGELPKAGLTVDVEKGKGARKKLFKGLQPTGGPMRKRMIHGLLSPRKRNQNKLMEKAEGNGTKQDEQGTSIPKSGI